MPKASKKFYAGAVFCISGTMSMSRSQLSAEIKALGGGVASSVTGKVTHLLTTEAEVKGKTSKVILAEGKGVPMVGEDYLEACKKAKKLVAHAKYEIGAGGTTKKAPAKKKTAVKKVPPKKKVAAKTKGKAKAAASSSGNTPSAHSRVLSCYSSYEVVVQDDIVFDAELNQQEASSNTDKFYMMQVLVNGDEDAWILFQHWGRTGETFPFNYVSMCV
jgi:hypothetical protein